jgi:hypothetical protein
MSGNAHKADKKLCAIAIAHEENEFKAVEVEKHGEDLEMLWAKSGKDSDNNWLSFAAECGLSVGLTEKNKTDGNKTTVIGFSSTGVAFYNIGLPTAREDELKSMVKMQAETLLPLPAEQMELTWRKGRVRNGQVAIAVAAARKEYLKSFVENLRALNPAKILLDCEGIVIAWKELFGGNEKDAVVVNMTARSTQVCLTEDGYLSNAIILDMGIEDFLEVADSLPDSENIGEPEKTEAVERFTFDVKSALEAFDYAEAKKLPIFVLSDGSKTLKVIVACLASAGLNAKAALPQIQKLKAKVGFGVEQLYEYRVPIGLSLMALDSHTDGFNLFDNLYRPAGTVGDKRGLRSPKVAAAIAAVMLVVFVVIFYAIDVISPGAIEKHLKETDSSADIDLLMQRQNLIKIVAMERPNLLELIKQISESGDGSIKLESFHFKKGQLVSITGQVQSPDQLYKFQESLMSRSGIKDVKIQNTSSDNKTKKVKFTMTFQYKNFTSKGTRT